MQKLNRNLSLCRRLILRTWLGLTDDLSSSTDSSWRLEHQGSTEVRRPAPQEQDYEFENSCWNRGSDFTRRGPQIRAQRRASEAQSSSTPLALPSGGARSFCAGGIRTQRGVSYSSRAHSPSRQTGPFQAWIESFLGNIFPRLRRKVPLRAHRAEVGGCPRFSCDQQSGVQRITFRAISSLADTHSVALVV